MATRTSPSPPAAHGASVQAMLVLPVVSTAMHSAGRAARTVPSHRPRRTGSALGPGLRSAGWRRSRGRGRFTRSARMTHRVNRPGGASSSARAAAGQRSSAVRVRRVASAQYTVCSSTAIPTAPGASLESWGVLAVDRDRREDLGANDLGRRSRLLVDADDGSLRAGTIGGMDPHVEIGRVGGERRHLTREGRRAT